MPNLRRLKTRKFPENLEPQLLLQFKSLTSLQIEFNLQTIPVLALLGPKLKELSLIMMGNSSDSSDMLKVFVHCTKLEYFALLNFYRGTVDLEVPVLAENLKLKKVVLSGLFHQTEGFLPLLLKAPLLDEVKLGPIRFSQTDVEAFTKNLSMGIMFQNLTKIELGPTLDSRTNALLDLESLAKSIVSFCPKLQTAFCDFGYKTFIEKFNKKPSKSVSPFLDLVKLI